MKLPLIGRLNSTAKRLGYLRVSLIVVLGFVLGIIILRFAYSWVTGFLVPDEFWYYNNFVLENQVPRFYREVFISVFLLFFKNVHSVHEFLLRGFIYCTLWGAGSVLIAYKTVKLLGFRETTGSLLLLSLPLFPVFTLFVSFMITETFGLFLALVGIYFMVRYVKNGGTLNAILSSVFFVMAYKVREPYLILGMGNILLVLLCWKGDLKKYVKGLVGYAVPAALVFPVPVSWKPLQFAQPVYAYFANWLYNYTWQPLSLPGSTGSTTGNIKIPPPPPPINVGSLMTGTVTVPTSAKPPDALQAFLVGLFYGYNPLFAIFVAVSIGLIAYELFLKHRDRIEGLVLLNMVLALASYGVSVLVVVSSLPSALESWTSTIIRMSHTSLPAVLGFGYLYTHIKPRYLLGVLLILTVLASSQVPRFAGAMQTSLQRTGQPINRLSFAYRAPYYRLYLIAEHSGKTLVVGGVAMRGIVTYMSMLPNVVLVGVPGEGEFRALLNQSWDSIFLYDDWYTVQDPSIAGSYPAYYWALLHSSSYDGYIVQPVWVDAESYAFQLVRAT